MIAFTDGTTQRITIFKEESHAHIFGEWTAFSEDSPCDNKLFFRICSECKCIEWEQRANSGHDWQTEYSYDDSFHWIACNNCNEVKDKAKHILDDSGKCTVCEQGIPTEGLYYEISLDGTYAEVVLYAGTDVKVRIADTYKGLPVTNIRVGAFNESKIVSIAIPDSITSIEEYAFFRCYYLKNIYITDIAFWCKYSFCEHDLLGNGYNLYLNNELVTELIIPNGVTSIRDSAFCNCSSLTSVTIPDGVTLIGSWAFHGCIGLTSIKIPDSVTSIEQTTFGDCSNLTSVTIGNSVTSIEHGAFGDCSSLTTVYYNGTAEDWEKITIDNSNWCLTNATRYYYSETKPTKEGNYWHYVNNVATPWISTEE